MALIGLGVSGGIGAYKAIEVARLLQKRGHDVQAVMAPGGCDRDAIGEQFGRGPEVACLGGGLGLGLQGRDLRLVQVECGGSSVR